LDLRVTFAIFAVTFATSLLLTYVVRAWMRRMKILDVPKDRKAHPKPVAYEGGIAMFGALLVGLVFTMWRVPSFYFEHRQLVGLVLGATCATALGVADDLIDLRPWVKLIGQLAIGYLMYRFEFRVERLSNPFGAEFEFWRYMSIAGTVVWYALLMNGINMIDGLDGLAAGITAISALTLCAISMDIGQWFPGAAALITAAVCLGFLPFNFKPASIFMGDAGSLLLGFLLASASLLSSTKAPALLALLIPMLALGVPIFDTVFAFVRRTVSGQHPFRGDRRHLHHRFLELGFSEKRTVLTFYYLTAYFGVTAYVLQRLEARSTLALVVIITIGMLVLVENMRVLENHRQPKGR
jgi:UDP-GlcNAc:undecaprenyl-phosphate/decaprenyl-phosphate GlcNAc-1-phosphate transferase